MKGGESERIHEHERNSTINLCRGISAFYSAYQPRTNLAKDENGNILADSDNILNRWKNYSCQLVIKICHHHHHL
jgi:hypothetical protein